MNIALLFLRSTHTKSISSTRVLHDQFLRNTNKNQNNHALFGTTRS